MYLFSHIVRQTKDDNAGIRQKAALIFNHYLSPTFTGRPVDTVNEPWILAMMKCQALLGQSGRERS